MIWWLSHRASRRARRFADKHYNRQNPESPQFAPPGRCLVLVYDEGFWITSYPFAEYVRHAWAGAWVCSAFRNEGSMLSSELVRQALAATHWKWANEIPTVGAWKITRRHDRSDIERINICMITFVDREKVRKKRDPGRNFRKSGFVEVGETAGGLVALGLPIDALPIEERPLGAAEQMELMIA